MPFGVHFIGKKIRTHDHIPIGLAVRICGLHPQGPGSTTGLGNLLLFCKLIFLPNKYYAQMSSLKLYRIHEHKNVEKLNGLTIVENLFNFIFE